MPCVLPLLWPLDGSLASYMTGTIDVGRAK